MPYLQSISQDFLAGISKKSRTKLLGGEASIDATHLYIDFKNTGSSTLQVYGSNPISADYLVVGGGGGGGNFGQWTYAYGTGWYSSQGVCDYYGGTCSAIQWPFYCWTTTGGSVYCNYLTGWADGRPDLTLYPDGAGGGAGNAFTGTVSLSSQNYSLQVGSGGAISTIGQDSVAFGTTAKGGQPAYDQSGNCTFVNVGSFGNGAPGLNYIGNYTTTRPEWSYVTQYNPWTLASSGYFRSDDFSRFVRQPDWGGGMGATGMGSDANTWCFNHPFVLGGGPENRDNQNLNINSWINDPLSNRMYSPMYDPAKGINAYSFVEAVGATGQVARMSVWSNVRWGTGITALGLKVAGGGMAGMSARSLSESYGGGYPVAGTTSQGTYTHDGTPNTGGGGGGGVLNGGGAGAGGSGIIRLRIKRSDLGI